ncbi:hypothetical protein DM01DRAFT_310315 [Hesseltinella vesiculosa]|uniref:Uncharacterized protein n=1 Tax=Hesseltinella vesiculosa TaxID=101127 RepID=A0A1X2GTC3_9FUNG|nr:hypothetical protein DM01DRAFT_310315 [Hesseltinella vesiculosa]
MSQSADLPPLQGDDPPRALTKSPHSSSKLPASHRHRHHLSLSPPSSHAPSHQRHRSWSSSEKPPFNPTLHLPPPVLPVTFPAPSSHHLTIPSMALLQRRPSFDTLSRLSTNQRPDIPTIHQPPVSQPKKKKKDTSLSVNNKKEPAPAPPPCTEILISPTTGQPILKRRRGRPPTRSPGYDEGGFTFLSPTVWNVTATANPSIPPSALQSLSTEEDENDHMIDAMTAFTGSDMDTVLPMPKKKRGRKPKTHIEGNSCFVWKDITAAKRSKLC